MIGHRSRGFVPQARGSRLIRLWLAAVVVALTCLIAAAAPGAALGQPVYVAAHCGGQGGLLGGHVIRPRTLFFACGGTLHLIVTGATFSSYGGPTARGRGIISYQGCSAKCLKSARHEPGTFTLSDIQQCSDGRLYYTSAVPHAAGVPSEAGGKPWGIQPPLSCTKPSRRTVPPRRTSPGKPIPVRGRGVVLSPISGSVSFRLPGQSGFVRLAGPVFVPVGTIVDATGGTVRVTVAAGGSLAQSALVYAGVFTVRQGSSAPYETRFVLSQPLIGCAASGASAQGPLVSRARRRGRGGSGTAVRRRRLWVRESGGSFGTTGRYVSTTVEGTQWLTVDSCERSSVKVARGRVAVFDLVNHRTTLLHAGQHYHASKHESATGPVTVVDSYWSAIGAHAFATAYGYLVPGAIPQSEAAFVAFEQHEGIASTQFQGRLGAISATTATVAVVSLITHDRQFGCRNWTGSYSMSHGSTGWLIARANITPTSCGR